MTSNTFTNTRTYANLDYYWNNDEYELDVINRRQGYAQTIYRDQALDNEGHAIYNGYVFYKLGEYYPAKNGSFTPENIEAYAQTW
ncbi:MAG: hypothetical protein KHW71_02965 [Bifidobacterium dentium]|nr:hypothetical protein [Bifidobacterium dentium]